MALVAPLALAHYTTTGQKQILHLSRTELITDLPCPEVQQNNDHLQFQHIHTVHRDEGHGGGHSGDDEDDDGSDGCCGVMSLRLLCLCQDDVSVSKSHTDTGSQLVLELTVPATASHSL